MEQPDLYAEMNLLVSVIARELGLSVTETVQGIETGALAVTMGEEDGQRFLAADYQGKTARITQDALGMTASSCGSCGGGCGEGEECEDENCSPSGCCC